MGGLDKLINTPQKSPSGRGLIPSLWRGVVQEAYSDNTVSVTVPSLLGDQAVRVPCVVAGTGPGSRVLVAAIEGRTSDLMVVLPG
jgi:hypothetical protein